MIAGCVQRWILQVGGVLGLAFEDRDGEVSDGRGVCDASSPYAACWCDGFSHTPVRAARD